MVRELKQGTVSNLYASPSSIIIIIIIIVASDYNYYD